MQGLSRARGRVSVATQTRRVPGAAVSRSQSIGNRSLRFALADSGSFSLQKIRLRRNNFWPELVYLVQVASGARTCNKDKALSSHWIFRISQKRTKRMKSKMLVLSFTAAVLMLTVMLAGSPSLSAYPEQAATAEVKIDNFSFGPATITVAPGTTITWVNHDDIPHTVVSTDSVFKSKVLDTDERFSFTFTKAGTYPYFCSIHPKMTATVVVK
jgi:plastocyanin